MQGRVELQGVDFSYPGRPNTKVLSNLSLQINPGEMVALVGQRWAIGNSWHTPFHIKLKTTPNFLGLWLLCSKSERFSFLLARSRELCHGRKVCAGYHRRFREYITRYGFAILDILSASPPADFAVAFSGLVLLGLWRSCQIGQCLRCLTPNGCVV